MELEVNDLIEYVTAGANIGMVRQYVNLFNTEFESCKKKVRFKDSKLNWEGLILDFYQMGGKSEVNLFNSVVDYHYYDFLECVLEGHQASEPFDIKEHVDDYLCFSQLERTIAEVGREEEFDETNLGEFQLFLLRWGTQLGERFGVLGEEFKSRFRKYLFPIDS